MVSAVRTSHLKCYEDRDFRLTLGRAEDGSLRIAEVESTSVALSQCPDKPLGPLLARVTSELEGKLPLKVDEDTRLDAVEADERGLTYRFTLPGVSSPEELDLEQFAPVMRTLLQSQTCLHPHLRPILDSGGTATYAYHASGGAPLLDIALTEQDCP